MEKKKMKLWKKLLIIFLVILLFFIIITTRKMIIINDLQNKAQKYIDSNNYFATIYQYQGNNLQIYTTYKKLDKSLSTIKSLSESGTRTLISYADENVNHMYFDVLESKIAILDGNGVPGSIQIDNALYTENLWQFALRAIFSDIKSEECNGKQCYKIEVALVPVVFSPDYLYSENAKTTIYFDKETGLKVREFNGTAEKNEEKINIVSDYHYEFDNVKDEDLKEPDISQYKIQENDTNT